MEYAGPNTLAAFWRRLAARLAQKADAGHSHTPAELGAASSEDLADLTRRVEALEARINTES